MLLPLAVPADPIVVEALPTDFAAWAVAANGRMAAILSTDGALDLWSVDPKGVAHLSRRLSTAPWKAEDNPRQDGMALSADGRYVALRRPQGGYDVWATDRPRIVRSLPLPHDAYVSRAAFTPSGDAVLLENSSLAVPTILVRLADGHALGLPIGSPWTFTPDGKSVVGQSKVDLALVDLATGRVRRRFHDATESSGPFAFSPDGRLLASTGEDPAWRVPPGGPYMESAYVHDLLIKVWRVSDGRRVGRFYGYSSSEGQARFHFLNAHRLTLPALGKLFEVPSGRVVRRFDPQDPQGAALFLPTSKREPLKERYVQWPPRPVVGRNVAVSPDGRTAVTTETGNPGRLLVWDVAARRLVRRVALPKVWSLRRIDFKPDGTLVVEGTLPPPPPDAVLDPLDTMDRKKTVELRLEDPTKITVAKVAAPLPPNVVGALTSKDGSFGLAVKLSYHDGASHQDIVRYDPKTGGIAWTNPGPQFGRGGLALSPDGKTFALAWLPRIAPGVQNRLAIYDAGTGGERRAVDILSDIWKPVFSLDGRQLIVAIQDGIELRDAATLALVSRVAEGQETGDLQIAPLPNGGFAVARNRRDLRVFDREAHLVATLVAFPNSGWAAWTPEGKAQGSPDGLAHIRRLEGDRLVPVP